MNIRGGVHNIPKDSAIGVGANFCGVATTQISPSIASLLGDHAIKVRFDFLCVLIRVKVCSGDQSLVIARGITQYFIKQRVSIEQRNGNIRLF